MIFPGNFLLSIFFILHSRAENISTLLQIRSTFHDQLETTKVFNAVPELHRNKLPSKDSVIEGILFSITENDIVVPKPFRLHSVNSQTNRQERAIDKIPPHKAFHEFHHEPVRAREPGQRRPTKPARPSSDSFAPRRFPEGNQETFDQRLRPTSPTTKRTRRPVTTLRYPHISDSQTQRTRPTSNSGITSSTRPSVVTGILPNGHGITRDRSTRRPNTNKPLRTSGTRRGTRRPGVTNPSGQFPPHKSFHDFHYEPVKPRLPGARRRTTVSPRATKFPDDVHLVTPIPKATTMVRKLSKPRATTRHPSDHRVSQRPIPVTSRRTSRPRTQSQLPGGRRVTQRRKTTIAATKEKTRFPETRGPADERPGSDPRITPTPRPGVTRRHTERGHRRTKRPTSMPSEYTRGATHRQAITQSAFDSSKALPPHKSLHEFHFDPVHKKIPDSKTSAPSPERITTPIYLPLDIASSQRPIKVTEQPRFTGERGRHTSSQRPRMGRTRFPNGKRPTTTDQRQIPSGRRRTTIKPGISSNKSSIDQKITTYNLRSSSTPRQRRPSKRPQKDSDIGQRMKSSSPSPRQFPDETREPATSKPLPPHKAFHQFHFEPIRPRLPGHGKTNGVSIRTTRPVLPSQYPSGEVITQKSRPTPNPPQNIWPRIPDGDSGFITQQRISSTLRPGSSLDTTRPGALPRFTVRQRSGPTTSTRKQSTPSRRPGGKRRKPTAGTKRPGISEKTFPTPQTPFQSSGDNRQKPTQGTQAPKSSHSNDKEGSSITSKPLPPHKAFHDFHHEPVKPKIPGSSPFRTPKPTSPFHPGDHSETMKLHPTPTLQHGIQPRIPDGDQKASTVAPDSANDTQKPTTSQRRPNGKRRKPTSGTKRPQHTRRPGSTSGTQPKPPARERPKPSVDIQTSPRQPEYQRPSQPFSSKKPVTPPSYSEKDKVRPTPGTQEQKTQPRFPSDQKPETTPGVSRSRTKPRFPGDRGGRPTSSTFPEDRRRTQRPRIPGSSEQPIKIPPHKAFHEFHYAPVRSRFLAGT